ncbi:MAG: hypothetical protein HZB43_12210 [candidate division Zixibacteria bacterium]|nr:hypothetical protein [candidate division Zixibacteria bacterium]
MPFTSPELVRAHLSDLRLGEITVDGIAITLSGTQAASLPHGGIALSSVSVKADRSAAPARESRSLSADWVALSHAQLVPGTALVASDGSLTVVYVENEDYIVDCVSGRLRRLAIGAIANGQPVEIWYRFFHVYTLGDDFTVDPTAGTVTRKSSGAIADGQTVLVDYRVPLGAVPDSVIERAVAEASESVLAMIDPRHAEEPVNAIIIGETHWAVAAVCRIRAAASLTESGAAVPAGRAAAQVWLELAANYDRAGREHLTRFAAPIAPLQSAKRT